MSTASSLLVASVQALADAVGASAADPTDGVRLLLAIIGAPTPAVSPYPAVAAAQLATAAMVRRCALISLARVCAAYNPATSTEAAALRAQVCAAFDTEILLAADAGSTGIYRALRALRAAVASDLAARGTLLPSIVQVSTALPEPSLVLAWRLYGTVRREPGLVARADVVSPLFMPMAFEALSS